MSDKIFLSPKNAPHQAPTGSVSPPLGKSLVKPQFGRVLGPPNRFDTVDGFNGLSRFPDH